jgi:ADP-ribose pyrophosphatase YjhB (NUDIX family)
MNADAVQNGGTVQAAGGLLWRAEDEQRLLAVVHRPRYDDWTLPKGKLNDGECLPDAALREVTEETGCTPCLEAFAGTRAYPLGDGQTKLVSYWHMHCDGGCAFEANDEFDRLVWLPAAQAADCLTHADEAAFVRAAAARCAPAAFLPPEPPSDFPPAPGFLGRLSQRLPWRSTSHQRLTRSVIAFRAEFDTMAARPLQSPAPPGWQTAVYRLLERVEGALVDNQTELGWRCFNAAHRLAVYALTPAERQSHAETLALEAGQKLRNWRKTSVARLLLDKDGALRPCIDASTLMQALQIAQEHNENTYLKLYSIRSQLLLLSLIGLLVTGYLFAAPAPLAALDMGSPLLLRYIILFGVLGASISGILSLAASGAGERFSDQLLSSWIAFARVAVGAVAALVVYAFLSGGFLNLEMDTLSAWAVLAVSFAAGFSERLLARAVGAVGG